MHHAIEFNCRWHQDQGLRIKKNRNLTTKPQSVTFATAPRGSFCGFAVGLTRSNTFPQLPEEPDLVSAQPGPPVRRAQ